MNGLTRLYGKGALRINAGRDTIVSSNGYVDVPENLIAVVLSAGFTRNPPQEESDAADDMAKIETSTIAAIEAGEPLSSSDIPDTNEGEKTDSVVTADSVVMDDEIRAAELANRDM